MAEYEPEDVPPHPTAVRLAEEAVAPYRGLLPPAVAEGFLESLMETFEHLPVGMGLIARLDPSFVIKLELGDEDPQGHRAAFERAALMRVTVEAVRKYRRDRGIREFLVPEASGRAMACFLAPFPLDRTLAALPVEKVAELARRFGAAVAAAAFLGLVEALEKNPEQVEEWGEAGVALVASLPAIRKVFRRGWSRLRGEDKVLVEAYQAAGWDHHRAAERLGMVRAKATTALLEAMIALGATMSEAVERVTLPR